MTPSTVAIYCDDIQNPPVIYYRAVQDGTPGEWTLYTFGTVLDVSSHRIELKGEYWGDYENPCHFVMTGSVRSGGDIRTLTGDTIKHTGYLKNLFKDCTSLKTAPELPYTELQAECYKGMFQNTGISTTPYLPATTLAPNCYEYMFYDSKDLGTVTVGFTDWGEENNSTAYATNQWLCGAVPGDGHFIAPPELPIRPYDCSYNPWSADTNYLRFSSRPKNLTQYQTVKVKIRSTTGNECIKAGTMLTAGDAVLVVTDDYCSYHN